MPCCLPRQSAGHGPGLDWAVRAVSHVNRIASPVDFNKRDFLLRKPVYDIEGNAAGAIDHNDAGGHVPIFRKKPVDFLLLRVVSKALSDKQRALVDVQAHAVAS